MTDTCPTKSRNGEDLSASFGYGGSFYHSPIRISQRLLTTHRLFPRKPWGRRIHERLDVGDKLLGGR